MKTLQKAIQIDIDGNKLILEAISKFLQYH